MITIKLKMKEFNDLEEAFEYFEQNIYPNLERKAKEKIKIFIFHFRNKNQGVSEKKKIEILEKYAGATVEKTFKIFL